jgi:hypothetical protein
MLLRFGGREAPRARGPAGSIITLCRRGVARDFDVYLEQRDGLARSIFT